MAFSEARFRDALAHLKGLEGDIRAATLTLRALLRLNRHGDALSFIAAHGTSVIQTSDHGQRALFAVLAGRLCEKAQFFEGADRWYTDARAYALMSPDPDVAAELAYFLAISAFGRRDFDDLREQVALVRQSRSPLLRALLLDIEAAIALIDCDYERMLSNYETGLLYLSAPAVSDRGYEAHFLRQYAGLSMHLGRLGHLESIAERFDNLGWSEDQDAVKFWSAMNLGFAYSAVGARTRAFHYFRIATNVAPTQAAQIYAFAARSRFARLRGEEDFANDQLSQALELAEACDWKTCSADELHGLLTLAQATVPVDLERAAAFLMTYKAVSPCGSQHQFGKLDPRERAMMDYTDALIKAQQGNVIDAVTLLRNAFESCFSLGLLWLATQCAAELQSLGESSEEIERCLSQAKDAYMSTWHGTAVATSI